MAREYEPALPALERFLTSQGRRKFLKPLYEDLMASPWGQPHARRIYEQGRPAYHSVSTQTVDQIVTLGAVVGLLAPVRERYVELVADPAALDEVLAQGAGRAREVAVATMSQVRERVGLLAPVR